MAIHIIPINDLKPHIEESTCECCPRLEMVQNEMMFIHSAFDKREQKEMIGQRRYHAMFGWCKVLDIDIENQKALCDLEADEISYYHMGQGYATYKRDKVTNIHILSTPISDLLLDDKQPLIGLQSLKFIALNPSLKFWTKK